jgi:hypothetical protein
MATHSRHRRPRLRCFARRTCVVCYRVSHRRAYRLFKCDYCADTIFNAIGAPVIARDGTVVAALGRYFLDLRGREWAGDFVTQMRISGMYRSSSAHYPPELAARPKEPRRRPAQRIPMPFSILAASPPPWNWRADQIVTRIAPIPVPVNFYWSCASGIRPRRGRNRGEGQWPIGDRDA